MLIQDLFKRDIFRTINGVVKADQLDESSVWQELDEFVITRELDGHFRKFFDSYAYEYFFLFLTIIFLLIALVVIQRICASPYGRLLKGIRENEPLCKALGKDTDGAKMKVFVLGAMFAGVAGSLYARYTTLVVPDMFVPHVTFIAWWGVIMGGIGNNKGVVIVHHNPSN